MIDILSVIDHTDGSRRSQIRSLWDALSLLQWAVLGVPVVSCSKCSCGELCSVFLWWAVLSVPVVSCVQCSCGELCSVSAPAISALLNWRVPARTALLPSNSEDYRQQAGTGMPHRAASKHFKLELKPKCRCALLSQEREVKRQHHTMPPHFFTLVLISTIIIGCSREWTRSSVAHVR